MVHFWTELALSKQGVLMMKVYHLKVSLFGYHQVPINQLNRTIAISENHTFEDLHNIIFEAFEREDAHLYSFFLTKKDSQNLGDIMDAPCVTNPFSYAEGDIFDNQPKNAAKMTLKQAKLKIKDVIHYWFDFGDDWWHRIRVERITTDNSEATSVIEITKKVGKSPAQYPEFDKEFEESFIGSDIGVLSLVEQMALDPSIDFDANPILFPFIKYLDMTAESEIDLLQQREVLVDLIAGLQKQLAEIEKLIAQQPDYALSQTDIKIESNNKTIKNSSKKK